MEILRGLSRNGDLGVKTPGEGARILILSVIAQGTEDLLEPDSCFDSLNYFESEVYQHHLDLLGIPKDWLPTELENIKEKLTMKAEIAVKRAANFEETVLIPRLEQALEDEEVPEYLQEELIEAIRISKAGRNVKHIGNRMLSQVAVLLALDLSLNDEQLKLFPNVGEARVEKIRQIKSNGGNRNE